MKRALLLVLLAAWSLGCSTLAGVPILSAVDAIGRATAHLVGWCDDRQIDPVTVVAAKEDIEAKNYGAALELVERSVAAARAKGDPIPEDVEVTLRLVEGALAAQAVQDGMRALSK